MRAGRFENGSMWHSTRLALRDISSLTGKDGREYAGQRTIPPARALCVRRNAGRRGDAQPGYFSRRRFFPKLSGRDRARKRTASTRSPREYYGSAIPSGDDDGARVRGGYTAVCSLASPAMSACDIASLFPPSCCSSMPAGYRPAPDFSPFDSPICARPARGKRACGRRKSRPQNISTPSKHLQIFMNPFRLLGFARATRRFTRGRVTQIVPRPLQT